MISLLKYVYGPWEQVRGYLETDLEHIQEAVNSLLKANFSSSDNTLLAEAIGGNSKVAPRYVANTGPNNAPRWSQVDLGSSGVTNRLPPNHLPTANPGVLIGRESGTTGDWEEITPSGPLSINGTALLFDQRVIAARAFVGF